MTPHQKAIEAAAAQLKFAIGEAEQLEAQCKLPTPAERQAEGMKAKLAAKAGAGWRGWDDPKYRNVIGEKLKDHVSRLLDGQPQAVDVANLAMFLWWQRNKEILGPRKRNA